MKHLVEIAAGILTVGLLILQTGCMTLAEELDKGAVNSQLHTGQTQEEVRKVLGRPENTEVSSNGKMLDVFLVVSLPMAYNLPSLEVRSVYVLYDEKGRLEKFKWSMGRTRTAASSFNQEWRTGRFFTATDLSHIQRHVTTRDGLIQLFGPPTIEGIDAYSDTVMVWLFAQGRETTIDGEGEFEVGLDANSVVTDYSLSNLKH
jgi:hypothetical protein